MEDEEDERILRLRPVPTQLSLQGNTMGMPPTDYAIAKAIVTNNDVRPLLEDEFECGREGQTPAQATFVENFISASKAALVAASASSSSLGLDESVRIVGDELMIARQSFLFSSAQSLEYRMKATFDESWKKPWRGSLKVTRIPATHLEAFSG